MSDYRSLPVANEIWRHYKGKDCRILFVAQSGDKSSIDRQIVIYEVVKIIRSLNEQTGFVESITTFSSTKYFRSISNFMAICSDQNGKFYRFELVETEDDLIWSDIADFDRPQQLLTSGIHGQ